MRTSRFGARTFIALLGGLLSASAHAHSSAKGVGDFYAGVLHPLTAVEHVLAFLVLGLLAGQQGARSRSVPLLFCAALVMGAASALVLPALPGVDVVNMMTIIVFGALLAAAVPLPAPACLALALLSGLSHGYANGLAIAPPIRAYLFIAGVGLAGLLATSGGQLAADYVLRRNVGWMSIALRVAGSWTVAIGMLVLAIGWARVGA